MWSLASNMSHTTHTQTHTDTWDFFLLALLLDGLWNAQIWAVTEKIWSVLNSLNKWIQSNLEEREVVALIRKPIYPDWGEEWLKRTSRHVIYQLRLSSKEGASYFLRVIAGDKSIRLPEKTHKGYLTHPASVSHSSAAWNAKVKVWVGLVSSDLWLTWDASMLYGLLPMSVPLWCCCFLYRSRWQWNPTMRTSFNHGCLYNGPISKCSCIL